MSLKKFAIAALENTLELDGKILLDADGIFDLIYMEDNTIVCADVICSIGKEFPKEEINRKEVESRIFEFLNNAETKFKYNTIRYDIFNCIVTNKCDLYTRHHINILSQPDDYSQMDGDCKC